MDSTVYGGQNNYYASLPKYSSTPKHELQQTGLYATHNPSNQQYAQDYYAAPKQYYPQETKSISHTINTSPKPFTGNNTFEYNSSKQYGPLSTTKVSDYATSDGGGYSTTEYGSNTYKLPDGQKSNSYRYETYQSSTQPITTYSTDIEYVNDLPILKDTDTLEQKMLKKSVTQQITEKRTVSMVKSSRQESSSKTFKFE